MNRITGSTWFERHPLLVAFELLGCELFVTRDGVRAGGPIVEVEAYAALEDLASHAAMYPSKREFLFGAPGHLYMYRAYGLHNMLNIVAHQPGVAGAVLIRAVEPSTGIEQMIQRRKLENPRLLMSGPGRVTQALGLRMEDQSRSIFQDPEIELRTTDAHHLVCAGPRIGITRSIEAPWRLFHQNSKFVSAHRRGNPIQLSELALDHHMS